MTEFIQVYTTTEKKEDAKRIAGEIIEKRLGACVQVLGPITSIYRWKGEVVEAEEWLCLIKSRKNLLESLEKTIKALHPYEVPEVVSTPILGGSLEYLEWLNGEVIEKCEK